MNLSDRIRHLRFVKGWGPAELALQAKISRTALYQIECGKTSRPHAATLRRIARALGVSLEYLLGPQEDRPVDESRPPLLPPPGDPMGFPGSSATREGDSRTSTRLLGLELEMRFRILLRSSLRDAISRIVLEAYELLPPEQRDARVT